MERRLSLHFQVNCETHRPDSGLKRGHPCQTLAGFLHHYGRLVVHVVTLFIIHLCIMYEVYPMKSIQCRRHESYDGVHIPIVATTQILEDDSHEWEG